MAPRKAKQEGASKDQKQLKREAKSSVQNAAPPAIDEAAWTFNEGEDSDDALEVPAAVALRGQSCLVTAACPRRYLRDLAERKKRLDGSGTYGLPEPWCSLHGQKSRQIGTLFCHERGRI